MIDSLGLIIVVITICAGCLAFIVLYNLTNINITEKMMENAPKTYDSFMINGVIDKIIEAIPEDEYNAVFNAIEECAEHAIKFLNSFVGMMRTVTNDYNATKMNVDEIVNSLNDPDKIGLVKDVLEKLG